MSNGLYVSAREAGRLVGKGEKTIVRWINKGELQGEQKDGTWRIPRAALQPFIEARRLEEEEDMGGPEGHGPALPPAGHPGGWPGRAAAAEERLRAIGRILRAVEDANLDAATAVVVLRALVAEDGADRSRRTGEDQP